MGARIAMHSSTRSVACARWPLLCMALLLRHACFIPVVISTQSTVAEPTAAAAATAALLF